MPGSEKVAHSPMRPLWHDMVPMELKIVLPSCHRSPHSVLDTLLMGVEGYRCQQTCYTAARQRARTHNCIDLPRTPFLIRKTNAYVTGFWTCIIFSRQSHCVAQASSPHYLQPPKEMELWAHATPLNFITVCYSLYCDLRAQPCTSFCCSLVCSLCIAAFLGLC